MILPIALPMPTRTSFRAGRAPALSSTAPASVITRRIPARGRGRCCGEIRTARWRKVKSAILGFDDNLRRGATCSAKPVAHARGDVTIGLRMRAVRRGRDHRQTGVRLLAYVHVERHFTKKRHAETFRFTPRAAMAENVGTLAAMGAEEIAHVLDDAEHRHVDEIGRAS